MITLIFILSIIISTIITYIGAVLFTLSFKEIFILINNDKRYLFASIFIVIIIATAFYINTLYYLKIIN